MIVKNFGISSLVFLFNKKINLVTLGTVKADQYVFCYFQKAYGFQLTMIAGLTIFENDIS